jgi:chromate reductase
MLRIGYLVGSLSSTSVNRRVAETLAALAPGGVELFEIPIDKLPLYNRDLEGHHPPAVEEFRAQVADAEALLFVTPEHNRSIPAALKNAVDLASRPYGASALAGKPGAILGASPSAVGTAAAQAHLRSILPILQVVLMGHPELYLNIKPESFDQDGRPEPALHALLTSFLDEYVSFVRRVQNPRSEEPLGVSPGL